MEAGAGGMWGGGHTRTTEGLMGLLPLVPEELRCETWRFQVRDCWLFIPASEKRARDLPR